MRISVRTAAVATAMSLLAASSALAANAAPAPQAKWTVMVYISGDNNLEDYVVKDLETGARRCRLERRRPDRRAGRPRPRLRHEPRRLADAPSSTTSRRA